MIAGGPTPPTPGRSGRRFVAASLAGLLVAWLAVDRSFRAWRSGHADRVAFGRREVSTAVDPLARLAPPGYPTAEWADAVARTHAMVDAVVGADLLDRPGQLALRSDLATRVAGASPGTAERVLAEIWIAMRAKAGPATRRVEPPGRIEAILRAEAAGRR